MHQGGEGACGAVVHHQGVAESSEGETMLHTMCLTLVLIAALAETAALHQWQQQYALAGIQQVASGTAPPSSRQR